jgi:hypothetical protein
MAASMNALDCHPGTCIIVFADGLVRSISYSVDKDLFRNLGGADGDWLNVNHL